MNHPLYTHASPSMADSDNTTIKPPADDAQACKLLSLPRELRDFIWLLAFTDDAAETGLDLFTARGPRRALLHTCHQNKTEATGAYKAALTRFWNSNTFILTVRSGIGDIRTALTKTNNLNDENLAMISHLEIRGLGNTVFVLNNGTWSFRPGRDETRYWVFCPTRDLHFLDAGETERAARVDLNKGNLRTSVRLYGGVYHHDWP